MEQNKIESVLSGRLTTVCVSLSPADVSAGNSHKLTIISRQSKLYKILSEYQQNNVDIEQKLLHANKS